MKLSKCCKAHVKIACGNRLYHELDDKIPVGKTCHYFCMKCEQSCDAYEKEIKHNVSQHVLDVINENEKFLGKSLFEKTINTKYEDEENK
jgi:hypothetical protein